jgi:acyl-CoA thioester hydrolase
MRLKQFDAEIALRWSDMDAMGHVNNVVYFRLMEEARVRWLEALGVASMPQGCGPILAHASCDFLRALNYPGTALVRQRVAKVGRSSVETEVVIERTGEPGVPYARGRAVVVWYDYERGASAPWPDFIRAALDTV